MNVLQPCVLVLCFLLPLAGSGQWELEAEGNVNWGMDTPERTFNYRYSTLPMVGLGFRGGYNFELKKQNAILVSLRYSVYSTVHKREFVSTSLVIGPANRERLIMYDNVIGPTLTYLRTLKEGKLKAIGIETGFQVMISRRSFLKTEPEGIYTGNGRFHAWAFSNDLFNQFYYIPFSITTRFKMNATGSWLFSPRLIYAYTNFFGGYPGRFMRNHHLQLGCGFIWRK